MAHTTAAKVTASQKGNVIGKRRGIKTFGGEKVSSGSILVRQLGMKYEPGKNVGVGKDFTLYAKIDGIISFTNATGYKRGKKIINVLPVEVKEVKAPKAKKVVVKKATAKKTK